MQITDVTFRKGPDGVAHVTRHGRSTSLCGTNGTGAVVESGAPCEFCMRVATDWIAKETI